MTTQNGLRRGQLVRFLETNTRWYFGLVVRVYERDLELVFFHGERLRVPREQVESIEQFLSKRGRVFSRTRSQLTEFFYWHPLERLHERRLREMQRALHRAGVTFSPEEWPAADTRIQMWRDTSVVGQTGVVSEFAQLLPQWVEPFVLPSGSRDPLGLQAPAERLVDEVLPGLTVFTFRAGYYAFLSWAITSVNALEDNRIPRRMTRRDVLNALERTLALSEFVFHGIEEDTCGLLGQRSKSRVLSGCENDRFRVPESILKNQNSAGCFALFTTSLVSCGLAENVEELDGRGLLPLQLTPLGDSLCHAFERRVDGGFVRFALGESSQPRTALKEWGQRLCFSSIARLAPFRERLLEALFLGNGRAMEKRFHTVQQLFAESLLGNNDQEVRDSGNVSEEDALARTEAHADIRGAWLSNLDVALHFYARSSREEWRELQALATFEFLALGLAAIFRAMVASLEIGMAKLSGISRSIGACDSMAALWHVPMQSAKPRTVRQLTIDLLATPKPIEGAALGCALLVRILKDPLLEAVWDPLQHRAAEPLHLMDQFLRQRMELPLSKAVPELLRAMVERHEAVSQRKNRQRWLYLEGDTLVRDDLQPMGIGLHALRFPQLGSLARDLALREEDLLGV